jgi:hypothetical protein
MVSGDGGHFLQSIISRQFRRAGQTQNMNTLNESEMQEVEGGGISGVPILGAYIALLDKMEKNPNSYTWMMDWYYR